MRKLEITLIVAGAIALTCNFFLMPYSVLLSTLSLSALAIIYFYFGFTIFHDFPIGQLRKKEAYAEFSSLMRVGTLAAGFSLAFTSVGILFKSNLWPGSFYMLSIGLLGLLIIIAISYRKNKTRTSIFYKRVLMRSSLFFMAGLLMLLIPKKKWIELKYRNYPGYVEALKNAIDHPGIKEYILRVEEERQKINEKK